MKRILTVTLFLAAAIQLNAGKVVTDSLQSNILGAKVKYNVYLPNGFDKTDKQYPVVYLLHGLSDDYTAWVVKGNMQTVVDELIEAEEAKEMIIVMPNAGGPDIRNTPCGYFNTPGWNYEDFFFEEFIPAVEKKYRAKGDKANRAVMGLSMGGGGSTVYCQRHPDMFSSCYAMSAWLENRSINKDDQTKDRLYYTCESVNRHSCLKFMEDADEATLEKLRTVKWFIDCGDDDFLLDVNTEFYFQMRNSRVKAEFRVRNGVHNWEYWHTALRIALPFASRYFE